MKKIPTLFRRDPDDRAHVLIGEVSPGCEWVLTGEGVPTRKFDGTCCQWDGQQWWARREVKPGKSAPAGFSAVEHDLVTDKTVGWEPMAASPFAKFHAEALAAAGTLAPGTYELVGPKINGNPEHRETHALVSHDHADVLADLPPLELLKWCRERGAEGVVWHHPDGRMAKLKVRDVPRT